MMSYETISGIILSVIFVATFLSIFYFTYVAKVENDIVVQQIQYLIDDFTKDMKFLSPQELQLVKSNLKKMKHQDLSSQDADVEKSNHAIMMKTIYFIIVLNVVGLVIVYFISKKYGFNMLDLLKKNFIILISIALTEFTFLNLFVRNYISIELNEIKLLILDKITQK
jgi:hypothetical protein